MDMESKILEPDMLVLRRGPLLVVTSKKCAKNQRAGPFSLAILRSVYRKHIPEEYPLEPNWFIVLVSDLCVSVSTTLD
jgi:hypothetical protein